MTFIDAVEKLIVFHKVLSWKIKLRLADKGKIWLNLDPKLSKRCEQSFVCKAARDKAQQGHLQAGLKKAYWETLQNSILGSGCQLCITDDWRHIMELEQPSAGSSKCEDCVGRAVVWAVCHN